MRPITITQTGTGATGWIPLDRQQAPFNVGIGCVLSGTATFTVQHTFDNLLPPTGTLGTVNAFPHPYISGVSSSTDGNYAFPVSGVRLTISSGTGAVTATILQGQR